MGKNTKSIIKMDIIYMRVSKEEKDLQDLESQKEAILQKYPLKNPLILEERGSAYNIDKIQKRKEFMKLLNILFDANKTTIKDLFLSNTEKKEINLYVWDYHRIMRNFEFNLLFGLLSDFFNIKIYSYKQGTIKKEEEETPIQKFSRYIFYSINAFSSEDYSYTISTNIKKTVVKENNVTTSRKGKKWGRKFKDLEGNNVSFNREQIATINERILHLAKYYSKRRQFYYPIIIKKVAKEFKISISKAYITALRKK